MSYKTGSYWHDKTRRRNAKRQQTWKIFEAAFRMGKTTIKPKKLLLISEKIWGRVDSQGTVDLRSAI